MAAGLCGFAIGTDTGGSIRGPAAFCGTFGIRPSPGLWSTDGMFSVSTTLDTVGVFTWTARDAAVVHAALLDCAPVRQADLRGVTLARPRTFFFDGLDEQVARCMDASLSRLSDLGVRFLEVDIPEAAECDALYNAITRAETIATFGLARFRENLESLNPDVRARIEPGLGVSSEAYIRALRRRDAIRRHACRAMRRVDGMISPTKRSLSPPSPADPGVEDHRRLAELCGGPTRPASIFGFCASSQPIHQLGSALPVGLQLMCPSGQDARLLSTAMAVEAGLGPAPRPDLHALLAATSPPAAKML